MVALANIPLSQMVDEKGYVTRAWQQYFLNPSVQSIDIGGTLAVTSGGTGTNAVPSVGNILVGDGTSYILSATLPAAAFPILTGDITTVGGSLATTLATVNGSPGSFGSSTQVATFTVNGKGLVTAGASVSIQGASTMAVAGGFGCNGKPIQTSAAVNVAVAGTAGAAYTATEQGIINALVALVNQLRAALVANGITV